MLQSISQPSTSARLFRLCSLFSRIHKPCPMIVTSEEPHTEPKRTVSLLRHNIKISKLQVPPSGVHSCCFPWFATQVQSCRFASLYRTHHSCRSGHPEKFTEREAHTSDFQQFFFLHAAFPPIYMFLVLTKPCLKLDMDMSSNDNQPYVSKELDSSISLQN